MKGERIAGRFVKIFIAGMLDCCFGFHETRLIDSYLYTRSSDAFILLWSSQFPFLTAPFMLKIGDLYLLESAKAAAGRIQFISSVDLLGIGEDKVMGPPPRTGFRGGDHPDGVQTIRKAKGQHQKILRKLALFSQTGK